MLTFQEMLSSNPFCYAQIAGAWSEKERARAFRHAESSATNITNATLLVLPNNEAVVLQLSEYLSLEQVEGIILFGKGEFHISQADADDIEAYGKPVLYLADTSAPVILKKLKELLLLKKSGLDEYIWNDSTSYWLELVNEQELSGLLKRLKIVTGENVVIVNDHFQPYLRDQEASLSAPLNTIKTLYHQQVMNKTENVSEIVDGDHEYLIFPLREKGKVLGYIVFQGQAGSSSHIAIKHIQYAIPAIISHFKKEHAVLQTHQSYKEDFLLNLLYNNIESEQDLITQGERWGWDFTKQTQLMVMQLNPKSEAIDWRLDTEGIIRKIRSTISSHMLQSIVFQVQGNIVIIIFADALKQQKEIAADLAGKIQRGIAEYQPDTECQIGIGRRYPSNRDLHRSFYEAKVTLELAKSEIKYMAVRHFDEVKIARLLSQIHHNVLHEYYIEVLGALTSADSDSAIETLEEFFNNNGDIAQTAEKLYVHSNTLRKRIKKIESTLNIDFSQYDDLFQVFVALKIMKMIK